MACSLSGLCPSQIFSIQFSVPSVLDLIRSSKTMEEIKSPGKHWWSASTFSIFLPFAGHVLAHTHCHVWGRGWVQKMVIRLFPNGIFRHLRRGSISMENHKLSTVFSTIMSKKSTSMSSTPSVIRVSPATKNSSCSFHTCQVLAPLVPSVGKVHIS